MSSKVRTTAHPASAAEAGMADQGRRLTTKRVSVFINIGSLGSAYCPPPTSRNRHSHDTRHWPRSTRT